MLPVGTHVPEAVFSIPSPADGEARPATIRPDRTATIRARLRGIFAKSILLTFGPRCKLGVLDTSPPSAPRLSVKAPKRVQALTVQGGLAPD